MDLDQRRRELSALLSSHMGLVDHVLSLEERVRKLEETAAPQPAPEPAPQPQAYPAAQSQGPYPSYSLQQ